MAAEKTYTLEEQLKAAYALNMCTVSVSQIVDYNDSYILEQEYDAILNNLNLEQIPKDEALLNILVELLNTITFFRIQDKKKAMIEKTYQHNIRNAIWSAVPNLGLIVAGGNPLTMAISLASQVGIGYMNYRKEKANMMLEQEKSEMELQITAIEQFNALKRELFTTAWRLAKEYGFNDKWRLTEKQIQRYNAILMDQDEIRKYDRLKAIEEFFFAYPPYWYHLGHTANYIAGNSNYALSPDTRLSYTAKAKAHFKKYHELNKFNILREDQITASFALEYIDLLLGEEKPDKKLIGTLLQEAVEKCGCANDILQLCAISYLKIGDYESACKLLRILVNEGYNAITNGRLLSRIYVSTYLSGPTQDLLANYETLKTRIDPAYLFPMPIATVSTDSALQAQFIDKQKAMLQRDYRNALNAYAASCTCRINKMLVLPILRNNHHDDYFTNTPEAKARRIEDMRNVLSSSAAKDHIGSMRAEGFRFKYLDLLNNILRDLDDLSLFGLSTERRKFVRRLRAKIVPLRNNMNDLQTKLDNGDYAIEDYQSIAEKLSFLSLFSEFMIKLKELFIEQITAIDKLEDLDKAEYELSQFCIVHSITLPKVVSCTSLAPVVDVEDKDFLSHSLFGEDAITEEYRQSQFARMISAVKESVTELVVSAADTRILINGESQFESYFNNANLNRPEIKSDVIAVIDDVNKRDVDLLLTREGFRLVKKNNIQSLKEYSSAVFSKVGNREELTFGSILDKYSNKAVNIARLHTLMCYLDEIIKDVR